MQKIEFPDTIMEAFRPRTVSLSEAYSPPTIHLFIGPGPLVGKTYHARKFAKEHGLECGSTSDVVIERLAEELWITSDSQQEPSGAQIRSKKEPYRWLLQAVGDKMCAENPLALAGKLIDGGATVIDGIRRQTELNAVMDAFPHHKIYWVTRPNYPKMRDNTDIRFQYGWQVVNNEF